MNDDCKLERVRLIFGERHVDGSGLCVVLLNQGKCKMRKKLNFRPRLI